jgi:hypothetical protein
MPSVLIITAGATALLRGIAFKTLPVPSLNALEFDRKNLIDI